jgi:hypothetical protein
MTESSLEVFLMIKQWTSEVPDSFVIVNGDMDYRAPADPNHYSRFLDATLGPDFPVFVTVGNHDRPWWYEFGDGSGGYSNVFAQRYRKANLDRHCVGEIGVNSVCLYKGILLVLSGIGETAPPDDPGYLAFLEHSLKSNPESTWRVASWHKNQKFLQLCSKKLDEVGWDPYEICRKHGVSPPFPSPPPSSTSCHCPNWQQIPTTCLLYLRTYCIVLLLISLEICVKRKA